MSKDYKVVIAGRRAPWEVFASRRTIECSSDAQATTVMIAEMEDPRNLVEGTEITLWFSPGPIGNTRRIKRWVFDSSLGPNGHWKPRESGDHRRNSRRYGEYNDNPSEYPSLEAGVPTDLDWVKEYPEDEGRGAPEEEPVSLEPESARELEAVSGHPISEFTIEWEGGELEEGDLESERAPDLLVATHVPTGERYVSQYGDDWGAEGGMSEWAERQAERRQRGIE
jgi:hypothetical protein